MTLPFALFELHYALFKAFASKGQQKKQPEQENIWLAPFDQVQLSKLSFTF